MKKYQIINTWEKKPEIEYVVNVYNTDEGTVYDFYYGDDDPWNETIRGTLCNRIIDDGNDITFKHQFKKKMDYSDMAAAMTFLAFINNIDKMISCKVLEVKEICNF